MQHPTESQSYLKNLPTQKTKKNKRRKIEKKSGKSTWVCYGGKVREEQICGIQYNICAVSDLRWDISLGLWFGRATTKCTKKEEANLWLQVQNPAEVVSCPIHGFKGMNPSMVFGLCEISESISYMPYNKSLAHLPTILFQ
ncbi:uncharacterized protein LOC113862416 [Abrus precatorius]|uniref:Uncharacterized protein LOC113862416 n=1 Tax=Abrus precatorius TaxID=3816 RepID=A0A8B8L986_ABRPR|nr:uncharacterized protein LOC113862416 [Abrus precatorius]